MEHILVTGGAGFIGSFLIDELIQRGHRVRAFDNLTPQVHANGRLPSYLNPKAEYLWGDMRNHEELTRAAQDIDVIFHEAAAVGVGQSQYDIKRYVEVNTGGTANLLDLLVNTKHHIKKLIVAASMSSYGEGASVCPRCGEVNPAARSETQLKHGEWELSCPYCQTIVQPIATRETKKRECTSIYAVTKNNQEEMAMIIGRAYGIPTVALRYFNTYGPRQSLSNPYTGVAAIFISRIKNNQRPVIYEDGRQTRDFISVHDIVDANLMAMEKEEANYQIYNVGTGKPLPIWEVASGLISLAGKELEPDITGQYRKGDIRHCFADISKIQKELGFQPKVSFSQGMEELMEWSISMTAEDRVHRATDELRKKGLLIQPAEKEHL